jgi:hypothetical protein
VQGGSADLLSELVKAGHKGRKTESGWLFYLIQQNICLSGINFQASTSIQW